MNIEPLKIKVRGSEGITFMEGVKTGDMTEYGVGIDTVWHSNKKAYGGCIDRDEATQIRDFLNQCIEKWDAEINTP